MPGPWSYETRTERTARLARAQAQPKDYGSQLDSFLSDRLSKIGIDPGVLASAPPQPAQRATAPSPAPSDGGILRNTLTQAASFKRQAIADNPSGDSGGGFLSDFASNVKDVAAGALHTGLSVAAKPFELSSEYGSPIFAALTGESRAGRHPILDAQGQPTGQFYRDKPDFRDMGASLLGLVTNPVSEYQRGQGAVNERINNPQVQQDFVGRGALRTFSDPLQVGIAALSGGSTALAAPAFNIATEGATQYAQDLPGWRNLSPDVQQALILAGSVIAAKKGPAIARKAAEVTGLKDAYQMGAVPGAAMVKAQPLGNVDTNPVPEAPGIGVTDVGNAGELPVPAASAAPDTAASSAPEVATPESAPPLAPASDGGNVPPPDSAPPGPPEPPSGGITPGGQEPLPTVQVGPFQLPDITPTPLNRVDTAMNAVKRTLGIGVEEDPMATPAMRARKQAQPVIDAQASRLGAITQTLVDQAFTRDARGRITDLVGNPTVQDVAARLPEFAPFLTPEQMRVMEQLRAEVQPYHGLLTKVGVDVNSRADVVDGGFYLPRGRADVEGADLPMKVGSGRSGGVGGRKGFEKGAVFDTQAHGIDAGYQYAPLEEALQSYARDAGNRIIDQHVANYFRNLTDENGVPVGQTFADRIPEAMQAKVNALRTQMDSMRRKLTTAEKRAGIATSQADAIASPLERLQGGITDRATARTALRDAQAELRLARRQALSASRDAGGAATKDAITRSKFKAAQARADNALAKLQIVRQQFDEAQGIKAEQGNRIGLGEVAPTGFGVRLPALNDTVLQAVKDADAARQELRQLTGRTAMPINAEAASNTTMLRRGIAESQANTGAQGLRAAEANVTGAAHDLAPDAVFSTMRQMDNRVTALRARGDKWSGLADSIAQQLDATKQAYEQFLPEWQRAKERAYQTPREQGKIGIDQLNGMTFPDVVANAANKYLAAERPPSGRGSSLLRASAATNNLLRGLHATADVSFMGIQGLLGAVRDPIGYGKALGVAFKAIADPQALGKYMLEYDRKAIEKGLPTSKQLIANGLHVGGRDTEFAVRGALPRASKGLQDLPVIKQSNMAFGYFGDTMRLELAQTALENAAKNGFNIADPAIARQVTTAANLATGWSPNTFGGDAGQFATFAPRFLQSQLELVHKGLTDGSLTGQEARSMMGRLIGTGVLMTVAANEASGRPLDYRELFDPTNANFMRIRLGGQDISLFGPWDSLLKGTVSMAKGDVQGANELIHGNVGGALSKVGGGAENFVRGKASPVVGTMWDVFSGQTFDNRDSHTPGYFFRQLLPFSVSDIGQKPLGTTAIGVTGLKASPLSPTEELNQIAQAKYGKDFYDLLSSQQAEIKTAHPDTWQAAVDRGNSNRQKYEAIKGDFTTQQQAADAQLLSGKMTREDWLKQYDDRKTQLAGAQLAIYGKDKPITNPRNASERYAQILQRNQDATGAINWDAVDAEVANLKPEDQAWIQDRQGLGNTPVVTAYKQAAALRSKYFDLPKYKGFTGSEAQQIDALWTQLRANVRVPNTGPMLAELKKLNADGTVDPKVYSGVRRRILGVLRTTKDRERFVKANPAMTTFFGGNGKGGPLTASEAQQLQGAA